MDTVAAYRHCEAVTRREARNFSYGIRLLPAPKRAALSAIYAYSRRVDDVADGPLAADQKMAALDGVEQGLRSPSRAPGRPRRRRAARRLVRVLASSRRRTGQPSAVRVGAGRP